MRILVCTYDLNNPASGSSLSIQNIASFFKSFGCNVVITANCPNVETATSYFNGEKPNLIISHQWATGELSMIALYLNIPFVMTIHGPGQYEQFYNYRWFPIDPLLIISSSQDTLNQLNGPKEKCMILNPIINREKACYSSNTSDPPEREFYTLIGNSSRAKGGYVLKDIALRYPQRKFLFVIKDTDIKFPPNVTVVKPTNEIWRIYHKTRILLHPSQVESFGRVTKEAQLNSIPVIATDLPGIREATLNGAHYVYPYNNIDAWCRSIDYLEENYESEISRLEEVVESYIPDEKSARDIYERILTELPKYSAPQLSKTELEIFQALTLMSYNFGKDAGIDRLIEQMKQNEFEKLPIKTRYRAYIEASLSLSTPQRHPKSMQFAQAALCLDEHTRLEAVALIISQYHQQKQYFEGYILGIQYLDICLDAQPVDLKFNKLVNYLFFKNLFLCSLEMKDTLLCKKLLKMLKEKELSATEENELNKLRKMLEPDEN